MFYQCKHDDCGVVFNCKKSIKEHERTHNDGKGFVCEICKQEFTQYSSL
jgi:hypothetical protein